MKKWMLLMALGLSANFSVATVYADLNEPTTIELPVPSKSVVPISKILEKLNNAGYVKVFSIQLNPQMIYNVVALDNEGDQNGLQLSAETGEIIQMQEKQPELDMSDIVNKVESVGYGDLSSVQIQDGSFIVQCVDANGNKVTLKVNASSGEIQK